MSSVFVVDLGDRSPYEKGSVLCQFGAFLSKESAIEFCKEHRKKHDQHPARERWVLCGRYGMVGGLVAVEVFLGPGSEYYRIFEYKLNP